MTPFFRTTALLGLVATLAACGNGSSPTGIHAIGVSQGCGSAMSPLLSGANGAAVRCAGQSQSPHGISR